MANNVTFSISADGAKAVQAMLRFSEAQGKVVDGFKKNIQGGNAFGKMLDGINPLKMLGGLVAGVASFAAIKAAVTGLHESSMRRHQEIGDATVQTERDMRALFGLGDNANNVGAIRGRLFAGSTAFGKDVREIAEGYYLLDSALGNVDPKIKSVITQQALLNTRLGGDFKTSVNASASLWLIYGKELEKAGTSAEGMTAKLQLAAEMSKASDKEVSTIAPGIAAAFKGRGFSFEDMLGALPTATAISGTAADAGTDLSNVANRMFNAESDLGIKLSGTFADQLKQVLDASKGDIHVFEKIFEPRLAAFALELAKNNAELQTNTQAMRDRTKSVTQEKINKIWGDPQSFNADMLGSIDQMDKNVDSIRGQDPALMKQQMLYKAATMDAKYANPALSDAEAKAAGWGVALKGEGSTMAQSSLRRVEEQMRKGGDVEGANRFRMMFGETFQEKTGQKFQTGFADFGKLAAGDTMGAYQRDVYTDERDAMGYNLLSARGVGIDAFKKYEGMGGGNLDQVREIGSAAGRGDMNNANRIADLVAAQIRAAESLNQSADKLNAAVGRANPNTHREGG